MKLTQISKLSGVIALWLFIIFFLGAMTSNALNAATPITRISTASAGVEATGASTGNMSISADGKYVAFISSATNLVAGDTNGVTDLFLKDTQTGITKRISTDSLGSQANGVMGNAAPGISADGRYVSFASNATNLVAGDTNGVQDIFLKDTQTGLTTRISTDSSGAQVSGSGSAVISADGRYVLFESNVSGLVPGDTNSARDIFLKDTQTNATTRISTDSLEGESNGSSQSTAMSTDARFIAFRSDATNLVAGDTNGIADIFVKDRQTGATTRVSTNGAGLDADSAPVNTRPAISDDGRWVAFLSPATNLVPADTNGVQDIFLKDTQTGQVSIVTADANGVGGNAASYSLAMSANGRQVIFRSDASNLVPADNNGVTDSFVKDSITGNIVRISTASDGTEGNGPTSELPAISADGRYLAFLSAASNLVPADTNGVNDIFYRQNPFWIVPNDTENANLDIEGIPPRLADTGTSLTVLMIVAALSIIGTGLINLYYRTLSR